MHYRPRERELSWREVDGEVVLLDERTWTYLHLNDTGATVWKALESGASEETLVAALLTDYSVTEATARTDVRALLDDLSQRELIVGE